MSSPVRSVGSGFAVAATLIASLGLLILSERVIVDEGTAVVLRWLAIAGLGATAALRLLAWKKAEGVVRQAERALLLAYGGVIFSVVVYGASTPWGLSLLGLAGDGGARSGELLTAAWAALLTVALTVALFMELAYARMPVAASLELRRLRAAGQGGLSLALALVFLFGLNYAASQRDVQRDMSYFKTALPGGSTLAMAEQLGEPVTAVLFYEQVSDVLGQVKPFFEALAGKGQQFRFVLRDHALEPDLARRYKVRGNGHILLLRGGLEAIDAPPEATATVASESFEIGDKLERARPKLRKLDEHFQKAFMGLTRAPRSLHLTAGHREFSKTGAKDDPKVTRLTGVFTLLKRFNIADHNLGMADGLADKVPDDARAVAVFGPRDPFLPEEARALLRYVQSGGRLLLMIDTQRDLGLDLLLHGLGVGRKPGVLCSERHIMRRRFNASDAAIVYANTYSSHPTVTSVSRNASRVATVFMDGGALDRYRGEAALKGAKVTFPLRSSHDFWLDLDGDFKRAPTEDKGTKNMIAAVTVKVDKGDEGRVVIIADGGFANDQLIRNSGNSLLFVDALRWLIGEEAITGDLSSEEDVPIEHRKDADRIWFYATCFGLPLPILLLGLWFARRRRRRGGVQ